MIQDRFHPSTRAVTVARAAAAFGAVALAAGFIATPQRAWANLLLAAYLLIGLGLAGIFFVALQYASGAGWSIALRRIPEAMSAILPIGGAILGLTLIARPELYAWFANPHVGEGHFKETWLSLPFFLARSAVYIVVWVAFAFAIVRTSRRQDRDGEVAHTQRNIRLSVAFVVIFAVTFWLASYDWIMSLEPHWYSTIFGVYNFAGLFLGGLAALIVLLVWVGARETRFGPPRGVINEAHLHDLGKLLFAFSTFWMYIWFSQYMLIWYADIPEESSYFVSRLQGAWKPLFILNMVLNWVIPFVVLMHRGAKRNQRVLVRVACIVLLGRWLDVYLMVVPPIVGGQPAIGLSEIGALGGAAGAFVLVFHYALRQAPLVPVRDPYLVESLQHH